MVAFLVVDDQRGPYEMVWISDLVSEWKSKYVWVSEAIDRELRNQRAAAVRATVVLDASSVLDDPLTFDDISPLVVHLPGQIAAQPFGADSWAATTLDPYFTGRWSHERDWLLSPERIAERAKTAAASIS